MKELTVKLNIKLIHSRPYYPQSQGKIERSHSTWKHKLFNHEELFHSLSPEQNWVVMLPYLAHNYNTGIHRSIKKTPYEVMFSIKSNMIIQCYNGGDYTQSESCDNIEDDTDRSVMIGDALNTDTNNVDMSMQERKSSSESLRSEVKDSARSAAKEMIKQNLAKYPPTTYNPGDVVLIKGDAVKKPGRLTLSRPKSLLVVIREHRDFLYTVTLLTGPVSRDVKVDKITSVTRAVETGKQSKANLESSEHKNVVKLHRVMVFQKSPESGIEMLHRNALLHGLELDSDNAGGGNCLFLAISQQLEKVFGTVRSHQDIRKDLVTFMSENPTLGSVYLPSFVSNYPSWRAYLDALGQDGTWGDHLTLIAAASVYHMSITIVSSVEDSDPVVIDPATGTSQGTIPLGHLAELHYMTLRPVQRDVPTPSHIYPHSPDDISDQTENQSPYLCRKERSCCNCAPSTDKSEACTLELFCDHLLIYIFALATMYCDQTTSNISAVCRRFNYLVKTQQFKEKQYQEWLKTVVDWSTSSEAYREKYLYSRKSGVEYMLCPKCGEEFTSQSGCQRGPDGNYSFYTPDDVCNSCAYLKSSQANT